MKYNKLRTKINDKKRKKRGTQARIIYIHYTPSFQQYIIGPTRVY